MMKNFYNENDNNICMERHNLRLLLSPHCPANCPQHVRSSGQGAVVCQCRVTHPAFVMSSVSCATWYERTAQLLNLTELILHLFLLYFGG